MILMQAPAANMSFGAMPSGATYVSDDFALIKIVNNSAADQVALQNAGCFTLTPFGGWGTFGFSLLSELYAADQGSILPGITGFPQHAIASVFNDGTPANNGTWVKSASGNGSGNWTQISTTTLASLASMIQNLAASAVAFNDTVHLNAETVQQAIVQIVGLLPALAITGTPPAQALVGTPYSFTPAATGGQPPYRFNQSGTLPPGISFSNTTGALSGTPTTAGTYPGIAIGVTDAANHSANLTSDPFTITVAEPGASLDFSQPSNSQNAQIAQGA